MKEQKQEANANTPNRTAAHIKRALGQIHENKPTPTHLKRQAIQVKTALGQTQKENKRQHQHGQNAPQLK